MELVDIVSRYSVSSVVGAEVADGRDTPGGRARDGTTVVGTEAGRATTLS
jgi:hypothetical protein